MAEQTLETDKDAYVDEASPDTALGGGANLFVRSQGGPLGDGDRRVLVSFDVKGDLPSDAAEVTDAVLRLTPEATSTLDRDLRCEEITGSWGETTVTWNNQPSVDTDHGLESSADDPHEWNVKGPVQDAFDAGERAELRVKDDAEGSPDGPQQEYSSREGGGQTPELVVTFRKSGTGDLSSQVTVSTNQFSDLDSPLHVREDAEVHDTWVREDVTDDGGDAHGPTGLAWDGDRGVFWAAVVEDGDVRKLDHHGNVLARMSNSNLDVHATTTSASGVAYDGTDLWIVGTDGSLARWSIDSGGDSLTHQETFETGHDLDAVAWDGSNPWAIEDTIEDFSTQYYLREYDSADGSQLTEKDLTAQADRDYHGLAFVDGDSDFRLLEEVSDTDVRIVRRAPDLTQQSKIDHPEPTGSEAGLTYVGRDADLDKVLGEWDDDRFLMLVSFDLPAKVEVGKEFSTSDLSSSVQPSNVSAEADLDSLVAVGAQAHLSTQVTAKENAETDLDASVKTREAGHSDINATIEPGTDQVNELGRATGRVNPARVFTDADIQEIAAQAGSTVDWTKEPSTADERTVSVRRVVQLVSAAQGKNYPRERTSHQDRDVDTARLERGDAVLYALPGDAFQPGDTVDWQGRSWEVVGLLGWERVGDEDIYQEVGLRRQATTHLARARGSVELEGEADLFSWIDVNVP